MGKKKVIEDANVIEEVKEQEVPEFDLLAISREDYEKVIAGIEILNEEMKMYIGTLMHGKFKIVPKEISDKDKEVK